MAKHVMLRMVTGANNNKFYEMVENANGTFTVKYGRIEGGSIQTQTYPMSKWNSTYNSKVRKGYKDVTELLAVEDKDTAKDSNQNQLAQISDSEVRKLIDQLMAFANKSIQRNYTVAQDQVTEKQVEEAQRLIDSISGRLKIGANVDQTLLELFTVIPRRMKRVPDHLHGTIQTKADLQRAEKALAEEQAALDVMAGQVQMLTNQKKNSSKANDRKTALTLLDSMGLEIRPCTASEIAEIKSKMGSDANRLHKAYRVENKKTRAEFDAFVAKRSNKKTELFWHGSRNENWLSIMENGLVLRPASAVITGKMFGYGTYFADKFKKSLGYCSLRGSYWANGSANIGLLALYDVHVGHQLHIKHHKSWCYQLDEKSLKKYDDYDSLFAEGGADLRNNEYIVYNEAQTTIKYLVEVR